MHAFKFGAVIAAILSMSAATAAEPVQSDRPASPGADARPAVAAATAPSRRMVRDQETGRLRAATVQEMAEMDAAARADRVARGLPAEEPAKAVVVRQHPNGMRSATLGPEHMVTLRGQRGADGRIVQLHDDPAHAHPAKQPAATEE